MRRRQSTYQESNGLCDPLKSPKDINAVFSWAGLFHDQRERHQLNTLPRLSFFVGTFTAAINDKRCGDFSLCPIRKISERKFAFFAGYDILSLRNNKVDLPPAVKLNQLDLGPGRLWKSVDDRRAHFDSSRD